MGYAFLYGASSVEPDAVSIRNTIYLMCNTKKVLVVHNEKYEQVKFRKKARTLFVPYDMPEKEVCEALLALPY